MDMDVSEDRGRLGGLMRAAIILTSIAMISLSLGIGATSPTLAGQEQNSFGSSASSMPPQSKPGQRIDAWRQMDDKLVNPTSANGYVRWRLAYDGGVDGSNGKDRPAAPPAPAPAPSSIPLSGPPLSFNDARFTSAVSYSRLDNGVPDGGSLTDRSYIYYEVGDNTVGCWGSCTLTRLRIQSRECIRAIKGNIVISDSYLEAIGQDDDHADVIQAYGPGNHGTITLRNTSIVAHNTSATAGIFVADSWKPDLVDLENVMFQGGPFGLRLHADGYTNAHLRMKNVCFVGPFRFRKFFITEFIIDEWTNVNDCVIQNGQLVVVRPIRRP